MQGWEYKLVDSAIKNTDGEPDPKSFIDEINELGKQGWEAVGFKIGELRKETPKEYVPGQRLEWVFARPVAVMMKRPHLYCSTKPASI